MAGNIIDTNYENPFLGQILHRYKVAQPPVVPSEGNGGGFVETIDYSGLTKSKFSGISQLVSNAVQNDNGSFDVTQNVDSGYGRKGISHKTYVG